jgi:hypothetical protein
MAASCLITINGFIVGAAPDTREQRLKNSVHLGKRRRPQILQGSELRNLFATVFASRGIPIDLGHINVEGLQITSEQAVQFYQTIYPQDSQ